MGRHPSEFNLLLSLGRRHMQHLPLLRTYLQIERLSRPSLSAAIDQNFNFKGF